MAHDHCSPRRPSYSEELAIARELIDRGDRGHALHHCIGALALEPNRREWQPMLEELLADARVLEKLDGDGYVGAHAARAWHMHKRGELAEALELCAAITQAVPHVGFQTWFGAWLEEAATQHVPVDPGAVMSVLMLASSIAIGRIQLLPSERAAAVELAPIARFAAETTIGEPAVWLLVSAVLRRAGLYVEAIAVAERARGKMEPERIATVVGLAYRANRDFDKAIAEFDAAFKHTNELVYRQEVFRTLADAGRWQEATTLAADIESKMEIDGEGALAHEYVRRALARKAPAPTTPPLDQIRRRSLMHGFLFAMSDATANALRQVADQKDLREHGPTGMGEKLRGAKLEIAVAGSEGPSNRLAMVVMFANSTDPRVASYSVTDGSTFKSLSDDADQYTLWKQDGDVTVQALPEPPAAVLDWVEKLALFEPDGTDPTQDFDSDADFLDMWTAAKTMPRVTATAREWVAATVYPRMPVYRVGMGPDWIYRWQVAALIGLAQIDEPWPDSKKRDAMLSLLRGAIDWPLAAAIRVAAEIALEEPAAIHELRLRLIEMTSQVINGVPNPAIAQTLLVALEMLPFVGDEYRERLRTALSADADEDDEDDAESDPDAPAEPDVEPAAESTGGKKPWWKFWGN